MRRWFIISASLDPRNVGFDRLARGDRALRDLHGEFGCRERAGINGGLAGRARRAEGLC
jgi:hypothetical protein